MVLKSSAVFFSNGDFFLSPENYLKSIQLQKTKVDSIFFATYELKVLFAQQQFLGLILNHIYNGSL